MNEKFRAWDKKNKKMIYYDFYWYAESRGCNKDNFTGLRFQHFRPEIYKDFDIESGVLMQYTGKEDIDETEIYKDDIVKHKNGFIYKVSFCNVNLWWYLDGIRGSPKAQDMRLHMSKVLGNIYENKDILKKIKSEA